jgi:hypothetical protein
MGSGWDIPRDPLWDPRLKSFESRDQVKSRGSGHLKFTLNDPRMVPASSSKLMRCNPRAPSKPGKNAARAFLYSLVLTVVYTSLTKLAGPLIPS